MILWCNIKHVKLPIFKLTFGLHPTLPKLSKQLGYFILHIILFIAGLTAASRTKELSPICFPLLKIL